MDARTPLGPVPAGEDAPEVARPGGGGNPDFAAVFEAAPGINLLLAPDPPHFTMLAASDERLAATRTTREGTLGRPLFAVFPDANPENAEPSGVTNLRTSLETVLRTRAPHRMPVQRYDLQRSDGTWEVRHWAPRNVPVLGPGGAVRFLLHHVEDVTEAVRRAEAHDRLRGEYAESEDARGALADANARLQDQQGELERSNQLLQEQAAELEQQTEELQAAAAQLEERTEQAEAFAGRLRVSEAHARAVFERAAVGMGRVGFHDARWLEVNDAFCAMLGYGRDEMLATPWPEVTHPDDVDLDLIPFRRMAAGELESYAVEKRFVAKAGHHVWARLTLSLVRDAGGRPDYEVAVIEDITERKRAEAERERLLAAAEAARAESAAASRAKSEFLAVMSHELRTPLNAISGHVQLLEMELHGPVTPQQRDALGRVDRAQRHLLGLINDILNLAKIESGRVEYDVQPVTLAELVADVAPMIEPQLLAKRLAYAVRRETLVADVWADREKARQVLLNLLSNAAKFTAPGGQLTVDAVAPPGDADVLHLRVHDTGRGIPAGELERIFEPFVQLGRSHARPVEGTGLGLAISRDLARGMGGDMWAESEEGAGSVFTLALRRVVAATGQPTDRRARDERRADGERRRVDRRGGGHEAGREAYAPGSRGVKTDKRDARTDGRSA